MRKLIPRLFLLMPLLVFAGETEREADVYTSLVGDFAASHILVQYRRAEKVSDQVMRSKKEALAKAEKILTELKANPDRFEALARMESDGPSAIKGGYLGGFNRGDMASKFESMVKKLAEGEIAASLVKTGFGYHVIRREPMQQRNYAVGAILVAFQGVSKLNLLKEQPEVYQRSKQEAEARIAVAKAALTQRNFAEVAKNYGDIQKNMGFLGIFRKGGGPLSDQLVAQVAPLALGDHGEVVELPIGFAILRRSAVARYQAARIWIGHRDVAKLAHKIKRDRNQAQKLAQEIIEKLNRDPAQFEALAKQYSAGPFAPRGGKMAFWFKGLQKASFEAILVGLAVGEMTEAPVETEEGFFIVKRLY